MDRLCITRPTPAATCGEADPPPPELIENLKDKQRIMELEAWLCRPRAERTAVSTTPVPAPEADSGDASFATPRG
eukprot:5774726-Heterocapsa_arctica.AAC.1